MKGTLGIPGIRPGGKLGNVVFIRTAEGYVVRERVVPANPRTGAQVRAREGFGRASRGWGALSDAAFEAWNAFGRAQGTTGQLAYVSLARKWLAMNPGGNPPEMPPAGPFFGDNVGLTIDDLRLTGMVSLTASQGNALGVVVEVLAQPLANARRKARARDWRTVGFLRFEAGSLTRTVALASGVHALAYRFVNSATGQATARAPLGAAVVG